MLDFPNSPTLNQIFTSGGLSWKWDGTKWVLNLGGGASITVGDTPPPSPAVGALWWDSVGGQLYVWYQDPNTSQWVVAVNVASALPPASTTVLGGVKVDGTSIQAAGDGTISTVLVPIGDNRIINGDCRIDQRWNGSSGTANAYIYTVDRWVYNGTQTGKVSWGRNLNSVSGAVGFPYYLGFTSSSAYTLLATDGFQVAQQIEADMVSDFAWGTGSAQPVTLSFWASSNVAGTFSGCIGNAAGTRSYPFTFSLPTANVWTRVVVTIPGDTAGVWVMSGNAASIGIHFDLGSGSNSRGVAGAWTSSNLIGVTGAVSLVALNGATFYVTGVKLEVGSIATPYNRQSLAKSMADCQRYYQVIWTTARSNAGSGGQNLDSNVSFQQMRATPTVTYGSVTATGNINSANLTFAGPNSGRFEIVATAAGDAYSIGQQCNLSSEL